MCLEFYLFNDICLEVCIDNENDMCLEVYLFNDMCLEVCINNLCRLLKFFRVFQL